MSRRPGTRPAVEHISDGWTDRQPRSTVARQYARFFGLEVDRDSAAGFGGVAGAGSTGRPSTRPGSPQDKGLPGVAALEPSKLTGNPFTNLRQHRLGSDVEPRSQDHRHGALRRLRSGASRDGPASGGPGTHHAGPYPRSADEDGLESGIGRALPANSRASPLCMRSPRGGSMNDEPPMRKSRDGSRWSGRRCVVIEPRPRCR